MNDPIDPMPPSVKEPEPWDRTAAPPDVPMPVQDAAIENLVREQINADPLPAAVVPGDLLAEPSAAASPQPTTEEVANSDADLYVNEFKPTDEEWENVKEIEFPHPHAAPLDAREHAAYKPEILERDAQGLDGAGDWSEMEAEKP